MKYFVVTILSLIILVNSIPEIVIYTSYRLNQDYITELFCVNKDKPNLKCNGSCHLKKEIKQSKEEGQNQPLPLIEEGQNNYYYPSSLEFEKIISLVESKQNDFLASQTSYSNIIIGRLFRPPRLLSI